jgi:hypothetical protein
VTTLDKLGDILLNLVLISVVIYMIVQLGV